MEKQKKSGKTIRKRPPAMTPEAKEKELIGLAVDLAEKQLRDGTASTQVIVHYLKLANERNQLEMDLLEKKTQLMDAQIDSIESAQNIEKLYADAIASMRIYSGHQDDYDE